MDPKSLLVLAVHVSLESHYFRDYHGLLLVQIVLLCRVGQKFLLFLAVRVGRLDLACREHHRCLVVRFGLWDQVDLVDRWNQLVQLDLGVQVVRVVQLPLVNR